ncbi:hypothetical protein ACEQPO_20585 [Bacillus sp. SL00103]
MIIKCSQLVRSQEAACSFLFEIANQLETTPEFPLYNEEEPSDNRVMYRFDEGRCTI